MWTRVGNPVFSHSHLDTSGRLRREWGGGGVTLWNHCFGIDRILCRPHPSRRLLRSTLHPFLSEYCIVHHCMQMPHFIFLSRAPLSRCLLAVASPFGGDFAVARGTD